MYKQSIHYPYTPREIGKEEYLVIRAWMHIVNFFLHPAVVVFGILIIIVAIGCAIGFHYDNKTKADALAHPEKYDRSSYEDVTDSYKHMPPSMANCKVYEIYDKSGEYNSRMIAMDCPDREVHTDTIRVPSGKYSVNRSINTVGNHIFYTADGNVQFLRPGSTDPVSIKLK